jgi:Domain of unknown function (DUF4129)
VRSAVKSRTARPTAALLALCTAVLITFPSARSAESARPAPTQQAPTRQAPTRQEIVAAVEKLRADPNLGVSETRRVLRINKSNSPQATSKVRTPDWLTWLGSAFSWLAASARMLVWVVAILLAGVLALVIKRLIESGVASSHPIAFSLPTHVQDLDIRPESLPDDIGGAALELWERGEQRAALALLYRGLLSRLAHVHGVPIRDSSTEGDCLTLAAARLTAQRCVYASQLIRLWQRAVYGKIDPSVEEFRALSTGFAAAVDAAYDAKPVERAA